MIRTRRWMQYSLRTFLVALTALGIGLGWIVMQVHRVRGQRQALAALTRWGGSYSYARDYNASCNTNWSGSRSPPSRWRRFVQTMVGQDYVTQVVYAGLPPRETLPKFLLPREMPVRPPQAEGKSIDDEALEFIGRLQELTMLQLAHTDISDDGLARLAGLGKLERLNLADTEITDRGLAHLSPFKRLAVLDLTGVRISDACLVHLKHLQSLRRLLILRTKITDAGIAELSRALPDCEIVMYEEAHK